VTQFRDVLLRFILHAGGRMGRGAEAIPTVPLLYWPQSTGSRRWMGSARDLGGGDEGRCCRRLFDRAPTWTAFGDALNCAQQTQRSPGETRRDFSCCYDRERDWICECGRLPHFHGQLSVLLLMARFNSAPALNLGCFDAGMVIFSPVRGWRPSVAALSAT
jgi:hypothetical protein